MAQFEASIVSAFEATSQPTRRRSMDAILPTMTVCDGHAVGIDSSDMVRHRPRANVTHLLPAILK